MCNPRPAEIFDQEQVISRKCVDYFVSGSFCRTLLPGFITCLMRIDFTAHSKACCGVGLLLSFPYWCDHYTELTRHISASCRYYIQTNSQTKL